MDTKEAQELLIKLGYDVGNAGADGIMGKNTRTALARFQGDVGIEGDLGPLTIAKLEERVAASPAKPATSAPGKMMTSTAGRAAISQREGVRLTAYKDSGGVLTIGVGHTSAAGPPKVTAGLKITASECDDILSRDLATFEAAVLKAVDVPLNHNEFDALVSLAFNIGAGAFAGSTVVKRLNAGDKAGAANAILMWDKDNGKTIPGLTTRRHAEREQFLR